MEEKETNISSRTMPLIPLRGLTVFPYMVIHFDVGRERSINALEEAMVHDQLVFLVSQKEAEITAPSLNDIYQVGTIAKIKQMLKLPGDTIRVLVEGISRGKIVNVLQETPYFQVEIEERSYQSEVTTDSETEALMRSVIDAFEEYVDISNKISPEILITIAEIEMPGRLADTIASNVFIKPGQKQEILEAFDPLERLEKLYKILLEEVEILQIEKKINSRVKKQINKVQKEYYLREQLKAIQKELGEDEGVVEEVADYKEKLKKLKFPKDVHEKIEREIDRLLKLSPASAETGVIRNYIDWALNLPWNKETKDRLDLKKSSAILDEDHYGLKKVKERILEYLAIRQLAKSMKGPILCLVGPPGVGKTSIAKSIARSLNRKFVRMSLGGVRDEAEIRGHRRTYVGAIPGRIISSIRQAGTKNPLFLLDEVDKLASDFRGDPASALLEVLDPEQNHDFTDHFMEMPFNLSKVMFITTANTLDTIPRPLLDRMEVIRIAGYTEEEKLNIASKYLLPKQIKEHGLKPANLQVSEKALRDIINYYTREAGVRNLERQIANLCRKVAKRVVEEKLKTIKITPANLKKYLSNPIYRYEMISQKDEVGIARGLAWTMVGGDTLSIEVTPMRGNGKLVLTGQLGDVMKESAKAGISYIRSRVEALDIDSDFHTNLDIHIHIPEGATPKDGPSAGITMATAVISAVTDIPVYKDVAMTGEITLRGRVLPVGGIKEKVLAAKRAGIQKVLLPIDNKRDLEDVPDNVKKKMDFVFVEHMDEVLEHALKRGEKNED
ncbi:ATP-dependent proteinase. Serine peptidase. MEROPS family S16 [Natronincola peptidivorans]|uniref:Lon protease n=1 Tax=Natronincola peptidivorans TaxID=426128 RepID=A0A1I0DB34_9FIRM|nr:endopeptidase La [Natronincola peptidivorans]SET29502.1 ATP-dependent proteinase. Serine peptidase. MEROPS family S16 [Natronincola peptidivorans]